MTRGKVGKVLSILGLANLPFSYVDPGIFGQIAQIGYVFLFAALSAVLFLFKPIKALFHRMTRRHPQNEPENPEASDEPGSG